MAALCACAPESTDGSGPCTYRISAPASQSYEFTLDSSSGNSPVGGGSLSIVGSRTLTPAEDPAGEWDILDSGTSLYRPTGGFGLPDSESPYRSAWRARIKPLEFHSFQELIADLKPDSVQFPLAIQGCLADSVFYDSTRTDSFDQTVSRIFVQGDSVVVSITESRYKTAAFRRYVFGLDSGLLTLERDHSAFMGGSQTVTMVRK